MKRINRKVMIVCVVVLFTIGTPQVWAQKVYKTNGIVVLDCTKESGFPQAATETVKGEKVKTGNPVNDSSTQMTNNGESGLYNKTVYKKLEIAAMDESTGGITWSAAFKLCRDKGTYWRLPTQREWMLMLIFKDALADLGAGLASSPVSYWVLTERSSTESWVANLDVGCFTVNVQSKTKITLRTRCVQEID